MRLHIALSLFILILPPDASADAGITLDCDFKAVAAAEYENGNFAGRQPTGGVRLTLSSFDVEKGTVSVIGNAGTTQALLFTKKEGFHIVEVAPVGIVATTLALPDRGRIAAHMSRQRLFNGKAWVETLSGECRPRQ